jgi:hypothetical protein
MKELYTALVAQLKTISAIKWIDLDNGQLDRKDPALKYPCILVKLNSNNEDVDESGSQDKQWSVQLRLAWDAIGIRTAADTPETVLNRSLAWTDTCDAVYNLLQGESFNGFDQFECKSEGQEIRSDGLVVFRMVFNTGKKKFKDRIIGGR